MRRVLKRITIEWEEFTDEGRLWPQQIIIQPDEIEKMLKAAEFLEEAHRAIQTAKRIASISLGEGGS